MQSVWKAHRIPELVMNAKIGEIKEADTVNDGQIEDQCAILARNWREVVLDRETWNSYENQVPAQIVVTEEEDEDERQPLLCW